VGARIGGLDGEIDPMKAFVGRRWTEARGSTLAARPTGPWRIMARSWTPGWRL
jgi:hypothetical protein